MNTKQKLHGHARYQLKRLRSIVHSIRGGATVSIGGHSVQFTTESAIQTEHTRYNAISERNVTKDYLSEVEGEVVLEIGAGHGVEACLAAVAGAKKVIAIEADGQRSDYIRKNAEQNGVANRVEVRTLKVGDGSGESVRLDDLDVEPGVLRMDIEGAEWDALASGPDLLSTVDFAFIEIHPDKAPSGKDISDIKKILMSADLAPVSRSARSQPFVHASSYRTDPVSDTLF